MMFGLCKDLEGNIFDFGMKTAANQMCTNQKKIVQYIRMIYDTDITNKLKNRKKFILPPAGYSDAIMARHAVREMMVQAQQNNLFSVHNEQKVAIETQITAAPLDLELPMTFAKINNEIVTIEFKLAHLVKVQLTEQEKTEYQSDLKTYTD